MLTLKSKILTMLFLFLTSSFSLAEWINPKANIPPISKPQRRSGAESVAPLPLPATPLKRQEKKRQPSPPALVGQINFSDPSSKFQTTQVDIEKLINYANVKLNIKYKYQNITLEKFSFNPKELPLLYLTGWTKIPKISDENILKLRQYIMDGGTVCCHSQCGRSEFNDTARLEIARIFPDRQLAPIDTDNPIFHSYFNVSQVRVRDGKSDFKTIPPYLEAVYIGTRIGILFSPIDLNCSWDVVNNPIEGGILYHQDDGISLGINIITYILADFEYAHSFGTEKIYHQQGEKSRDQLVIAQISHNGDYNCVPHALPNLMKYMAKNTTLNVQFKQEIVSINNIDIFKHPVLYMTGLRDFRFNDGEVKQLNTYLKSGGVLIADASAGNVAFDVAFRREMKKVLPGQDLEQIPLDSPLFQMPYIIKNVEYAEIVKAQDPTLNTPVLFGAKNNDGVLCVIYSPFGLANGVEGLGYPYNRGFSDTDATRIFVNILSYSLTH